MALGPSFAKKNGICVCKECNLTFDTAEVINGKVQFPEEGVCPNCNHPWHKDYRPEQEMVIPEDVQTQLNSLVKELDQEKSNSQLAEINTTLKSLDKNIKAITKSINSLCENMSGMIKVINQEIEIMKLNRNVRKGW